MLLIEKVMALKKARIFSEIPENDLIDTASIIVEVPMEIGQKIFSKNDQGDSMYIIHSGCVRVHDGEHTLAFLRENDVFGELSLLDAEKRSASVSCEEPGLLLQLNQQPFYEILGDNIEILKGILKTMCGRIRLLDEEATDLYRRLIQR